VEIGAEPYEGLRHERGIPAEYRPGVKWKSAPNLTRDCDISAAFIRFLLKKMWKSAPNLTRDCDGSGSRRQRSEAEVEIGAEPYEGLRQKVPPHCRSSMTCVEIGAEPYEGLRRGDLCALGVDAAGWKSAPNLTRDCDRLAQEVDLRGRRRGNRRRTLRGIAT